MTVRLVHLVTLGWATAAWVGLLMAGFALDAALAAYPGANGRIVLEGQSGRLVSVNPDGSVPVDLGVTGTNPAVSPNGQTVVFESGGALSTIRADGGTGSLRPLGTGAEPVFSPDGAFIAFERNGDIWRMRKDGTGSTRLVTGGTDPAYSPNGRRLAFARDSTIRTVNAQGGEEKRLRGGLERPPQHLAWSPDGGSIAFTSELDGYIASIYQMNSDGSGLRLFREGDSYCYTGPTAGCHPMAYTHFSRPEYSPDGSTLAFSDQRADYDSSLPPGEQLKIYSWVKTAPVGSAQGNDEYVYAGGAPAWQPLNPPANDMFAGAKVLSGSDVSAKGKNFAATKEAGEPQHAGISGGTSVWYRWKATAAGQVTMDTCGSDFDTLLGVYTGASVSQLTTVAANDDAACAGASTLQSKVTFAAEAGRTYRIAVDGYTGVWGRIALHVTLSG